ncbi:MAG: GNAT family N-acetyltransferase [Gaiellaceae bacterium]
MPEALRIEALDAAAVRAHMDELAQLLLDAHSSGMALGLPAPLTHDRAREAYAGAAAKLAPGERVLLAAFDGDELVGAVQLDRAEAGNGRHRGEVRRLVVRADRRGSGIGRALLEAVVECGRALDLRLLWLSTHEGATAERIYERLGWTRVGVIPDWAVLPNGDLAGNSFYFFRLNKSLTDRSFSPPGG